MISTIDLLLNQKDDEICLSVVIPTYTLAPLRLLTRGVIRKNISKAIAMVRNAQSRSSENTTRELIAGLEELEKEIDANRLDEGVGIFVSTTIRKIVYFPFVVTEKILLGKSFETRD